jgi:hypothetical protein
MPQTLHNQRGPADSRIQHLYQYSGSAGGSHPPEGGILLPCCFAFLAGCLRVARKAKSTPMPRHSYRERNYAFGQAMLKLRSSIGLTQAGLAEGLRVSGIGPEKCCEEWRKKNQTIYEPLCHFTHNPATPEPITLPQKSPIKLTKDEKKLSFPPHLE